MFNNIHLLHDWEGNMKIYSPMKNHYSRGQRPSYMSQILVEIGLVVVEKSNKKLIRTDGIRGTT